MSFDDRSGQAHGALKETIGDRLEQQRPAVPDSLTVRWRRTAKFWLVTAVGALLLVATLAAVSSGAVVVGIITLLAALIITAGGRWWPRPVLRAGKVAALLDCDGVTISGRQRRWVEVEKITRGSSTNGSTNNLRFRFSDGSKVDLYVAFCDTGANEVLDVAARYLPRVTRLRWGLGGRW